MVSESLLMAANGIISTIGDIDAIVGVVNRDGCKITRQQLWW